MVFCHLNSSSFPRFWDHKFQQKPLEMTFPREIPEYLRLFVFHFFPYPLRIHGTGVFTYIYKQKSTSHVGKYTVRPMGSYGLFKRNNFRVSNFKHVKKDPGATSERVTLMGPKTRRFKLWKKTYLLVEEGARTPSYLKVKINGSRYPKVGW